MVSGAYHTGHDDGVHETSCDIGAGHLKDDRKGGCGGGFGGEFWVGVGHVETDEEDGDDVEDEDSPEDVFDHSRHVLCGIFGFSRSDSNGLGATVCEGSGPKFGMLDKKLTCKRSSDENGSKSANSIHKWRISKIPVFTSNVDTVCVSSTVDCDSEEYEDDDSSNF